MLSAMGGVGRREIDDDEVIRRDTSEFDRGLSFFDAIYGFAVTLLIVNVDLPGAEAWQDLGSLAGSGLGRQLSGVVLSFVVICALWRVNVRMIKGLTGLDGPMVFANLVATGLVILVPFTTDAISDPATSDLALPTVFYALNIAGVALAQAAVYQLGRAAGLERRPTSPRENGRLLVAAVAAPAVFLASVPVALTVGAGTAQLVWVSLVIVLPLTGRLANRARGT
ncbi:TMEM175 family protein [Dietzia sp. PP-33]|jgi:uncharacterized membrane protein|uniref:TMEM175 family protein n=1 Tax=Dietzia sp. PP-33 TaxID=2957500 RepID=UPI0029A6C194|nr:TMEM175 family protein [Dietzia sp. PP-33]MDX2357032.1 TMEM175 family protein [Dietzia sp. PP-33]